MMELCGECNFECSSEGIVCQSMDSSHVSLVSVTLTAKGFAEFACDDDCTLGMNLTNLNKILKCSGSKDSMTISAKDTENVRFKFENEAAEDEKAAKIQMEEPIEQQFALRYLSSFAKSSTLSSRVQLSFSEAVPLQVSFHMEDLGCIKYFLAPKIEEED